MFPTFTVPQVKLLTGWKPKGFYERRLHLLILILLDTGCRITEALTLHVADIDMDNLLILLDGKAASNVVSHSRLNCVFEDRQLWRVWQCTVRL